MQYCSIHNKDYDKIRNVKCKRNNEIRKKDTVKSKCNPEIFCNLIPYCDSSHPVWFFQDIQKSLVTKFLNIEALEETKTITYGEKPQTPIYRRMEEFVIKDQYKKSKGWEIRRKRWANFYHKLFGIFTFHPELWESESCLCLMRCARITKADKEVRLFALQKDLEYLEEIKDDLYRLMLTSKKNLGQRDLICKYAKCGGVYARQIVLECEIFVQDYNTADGIPDHIFWYDSSNPPLWVYTYVKRKAKLNKEVPRKQYLGSVHDDEALKLFPDEPYFMDPKAMYRNRNLIDEEEKRCDTIFRFIRKFRRYTRKKNFDETRELKITINKEIGRDRKTIGKNFQRFHYYSSKVIRDHNRIKFAPKMQTYIVKKYPPVPGAVKGPLPLPFKLKAIMEYKRRQKEEENERKKKEEKEAKKNGDCYTLLKFHMERKKTFIDAEKAFEEKRKQDIQLKLQMWKVRKYMDIKRKEITNSGEKICRGVEEPQGGEIRKIMIKALTKKEKEERDIKLRRGLNVKTELNKPPDWWDKRNTIKDPSLLFLEDNDGSSSYKIKLYLYNKRKKEEIDVELL